MLEIELQIGEPLEEALRRMYVDERLSIAEMAKRLGAAQQTVFNWLREINVTSRGFTFDEEGE